MRKALFAGIAALVLTAAAPARDYRERFMSEAPERWKSYREFAKRLQGSALHTQYRGGLAKGEVFFQNRTMHKQAGRYCLSISETSGPVLERGSKPAEATGVNSRYAFALVKRRPDSGWVLTQLDQDLRDDRPINPISQEQDTLLAFCPLLMVERRLLLDLMKDPDFKIKNVVPVVSNGANYARLDFSSRPQKRTREEPWMDGWVLLDPERGWIVKEVNVEALFMGGIQAKLTINNDFKVNESGFAVPTGSLKRIQFADVRITRKEDVVVSKYDFYEDDHVPETTFLLTAFGLPEPFEPKPPTHWYLWAALAGGACVLLAASIRWYRLRNACVLIR